MHPNYIAKNLVIHAPAFSTHYALTATTVINIINTYRARRIHKATF